MTSNNNIERRGLVAALPPPSLSPTPLTSVISTNGRNLFKLTKNLGIAGLRIKSERIVGISIIRVFAVMETL